MAEATTATSQEPQVLEVNDDHEIDSAYGDDDGSSYTASLTSSIRNHIYENGRRYHAYKEGSYLAPNDDAENDRMDMHHHLATLLIDGKLHVSPIGEKAQKVLDIGTGTGIWAIEMGDEFPSAEVIGVDLSPIQPTMVPPNVKFEIDDVEQDWTYPKDYDLIHSRFMSGSIGDWPKLMKQAFEHTKPGGWVEFKDWDILTRSADNTLPDDSPVLKFHKLLIEGIEKTGRFYTPGPHLKGWLEDAGFTNVQEKVIPVPIGYWAKDKKYRELGAWNLLCLVEGLEAISMRLLTVMLGWKPEEVHVLIAQVREALKNRKVHAQYTYYVVWAQKPEEKAAATQKAQLASTEK